DVEIVSAGSCCSYCSRSHSQVVRHKDRKRILSRLDAVQQNQVVMEKIVVEDDSAFGKSEVGRRGLAVHYRLQFADRGRYFHVDGSLAARGLVRGYRQFLVQFHLTGNDVVPNGRLAFNKVSGSVPSHREFFGSHPFPVFKNTEAPLLDLDWRES